MRCIISPYNSGYHNIGSEEYFMSNFEEDIFYLYINSPCIVIGKNQNAYAEINRTYVEENQVQVVRRRSGGGAVYHDHGNLNFGFIVKNDNKDFDTVFREFTAPILEVLNDFGVPAEFAGRNDLVVEGKKISGNAQFRTTDKILQHGTLLFDSDLTAISNALNASPLKFEDKSIKSVRSRVTNIKEHLSTELSIEDLAESIVQKVRQKFGDSEIYDLSQNDRNAIRQLAENKYSTWDWVYGNSPKFRYNNIFKFQNGTVEIGLNAEAGIIQEANIYGDFFGDAPIENLIQKLIQVPYDKISIEKVLGSADVGDYIWGLDNATFVENILQK